MKRFMAIYTASPDTMSKPMTDAQKKAGMEAWMTWSMDNQASILDHGGPLGKTKAVGKTGVSDIKNAMTAYALIQAASHEEAANLFLNHPHFAIFPGDGVEVMEILPMPDMSK